MASNFTPSKRMQDHGLTDRIERRKWQKTSLHITNQSLKLFPGHVIFRLLCPASRTGSIIGKGGSIIQQIRQETGSRITIEDTISGCDERVVVVSGSAKISESGVDKLGESDKEANKSDDGNVPISNNGDDNERTEPSKENTRYEKETSPAQKALQLVFERMTELPQGTDTVEAGSNIFSSTVRLLVFSSQVGCLLGKDGSIINELLETGAKVSVLPKDNLPSCASASDELVQIVGDKNAAKKALVSVSGLIMLHQPEDIGSLAPVSTRMQLPSLSSEHSHRDRENLPPVPPHQAWGPAPATAPNFPESSLPDRPGPPQTLTFHLLCSSERVGGIIGKGGTNIKAVMQETGCDVKVVDAIADSVDRVITISGPAYVDDRISASQDAVLRVQARISRVPSDSFKDKRAVARIIVLSHQVGFLLGNDGSGMSELSRLSGAHIRMLEKHQVPKCVSVNDEVVQINGQFETVQEGLLQVTTRLRNQLFRDTLPITNHPSNPPFQEAPPFPPFLGRREPSPPFRSFHGFDGIPGPRPTGFHLHDDQSSFMHNKPMPGAFPPPSERKPWFSQGFNEGPMPLGVPDVPGLPRASNFSGINTSTIITNTTVEVVVPRSIIPVLNGDDASCLNQIRQISDAKVTIVEPIPGRNETVIVISGTPEQSHAAQSLIQAFVLSEKEVS